MLILICSAMVVVAGVYVLAPLFTEPKGNLDVELLAETELDRLLNRKAVVYSNLKELEFEYKMGRLSDADFKRLDAGYRSEAAALLQKLDQLGVEENLDDTIERDIAALKVKRSARSGEGHPSGPAQCPACGADVDAGKKFCADCGARL
jgi:hypothetical protein